MATLAQIRSNVDSWLTAQWPTIQSRQATYLANHGRYWQGLVSHTAHPADGASTVPDRIATKPVYQSETWVNGAGPDASPWPCSLEIHQYDGPQGQGFVAFARCTVSGVTYERAQQVGPETWRTFGWRQVTAVTP